MNDKKDHNCTKKEISKNKIDAFKGFFECCLTDTPAPIPEKLQALRQKLPERSYSSVKYRKNKDFTIFPDMIVADLLLTFPYLKDQLSELHPLGMMSPALSQISLEMLFSDMEIDIPKVCQDLASLINQQNPLNAK
jgi:hypothetical protein